MFILGTSQANLLAFFHQPGDTVLVVFRPATPRATAHLHGRNAKSPCQLDMTRATVHTHHCDNPVIINTNLSASAQGANVLWSRRKGGRGGRRKGRHTKYRSWYNLSGCGITQQVWIRVCTQDSQTRGRLIPAPPSALAAVVCTWRIRRWRGLSLTYTYSGKKRRRIIPTKTSALMGPTTVITRHRFQIRHLSSQLRVPRKQKAL